LNGHVEQLAGNDMLRTTSFAPICKGLTFLLIITSNMAPRSIDNTHNGDWYSRCWGGDW